MLTHSRASTTEKDNYHHVAMHPITPLTFFGPDASAEYEANPWKALVEHKREAMGKAFKKLIELIATRYGGLPEDHLVLFFEEDHRWFPQDEFALEKLYENLNWPLDPYTDEPSAPVEEGHPVHPDSFSKDHPDALPREFPNWCRKVRPKPKEVVKARDQSPILKDLVSIATAAARIRPDPDNPDVHCGEFIWYSHRPTSLHNEGCNGIYKACSWPATSPKEQLAVSYNGCQGVTLRGARRLHRLFEEDERCYQHRLKNAVRANPYRTDT